ncbi:hypothetical protein DEU56DRAFT_757595 [Suillus clintonianus]|uniref:uncharacterized protein n=1 Tax=Suillus clintonianus TaxID=1904413 RepID=UPI001B85CD11|nr:uncharacterized protein DEU56DRAFT_757595 [Suillus clintonianus]KAG2131343.1 hypothetical protein DEU56DRAFT_757595 [Suillus clintonianus]
MYTELNELDEYNQQDMHDPNVTNILAIYLKLGLLSGNKTAKCPDNIFELLMVGFSAKGVNFQTPLPLFMQGAWQHTEKRCESPAPDEADNIGLDEFVLKFYTKKFFVMIMGEPNDSNGLLIDWEFAGTISFMSCALLIQLAELQANTAQQEARKSLSKTLVLPPSCISQSYVDDLNGPKGKERQESVPNLLPDSWSNLNLEEWQAILKDNMETPITFNSIINLLEHHLAALQDDEERSYANENLKKSAEKLNRCMKWVAEVGPSTTSIPQSAKQKKHKADHLIQKLENDSGDSAAMMDSDDSD